MKRSLSPAKSQIAAIGRTILALSILLAFWSAVAYSFRAELTPPTLRLIQSIRGLGAEPLQSRHFDVLNNSRAGPAKIETIIGILEADYKTIQAYLALEAGQDPPEAQDSLRDSIKELPIRVLITNGAGPALANEGQLNLFYDGNTINLDTVPPFLVLLSREDRLNAGTHWFLAGGFAIYVSEEIGRAKGLGQSSDAWVALLQQQNALLPFATAWDISLPTDEAGVYDFVRGLAQGGSFVRWLSDTYGPEAVQALLNGQRLENVTGLFFDEAERRWLAALAGKDLHPRECRAATLGQPFWQSICQRLE